MGLAVEPRGRSPRISVEPRGRSPRLSVEPRDRPPKLSVEPDRPGIINVSGPRVNRGNGPPNPEGMIEGPGLDCGSLRPAASFGSIGDAPGEYDNFFVVPKAPPLMFADKFAKLKKNRKDFIKKRAEGEL